MVSIDRFCIISLALSMLAGLGAGGLPLGCHREGLQKRHLLKVVHKRNLTLDEIGKRILRLFHGGENKNRSERYGAQRLNSS